MGAYGQAARRSKGVDYPFDPGHGDSWWRAGTALRREAIRRTLEEFRDPHGSWGIRDRISDVQAVSKDRSSFTAELLSEETMPRLSLLRAVDI